MPRVHFGNTVTPIHELEVAGAKVAQRLRDCGVPDGATVALWLHNDPHFLAALAAIRCLHGHRVLIPYTAAPAEAVALLQRTRSAVLVVHDDLLARAAQPIAWTKLDLRIITVSTPRALQPDPSHRPAPSTTGLPTWDWDTLVAYAPQALELPSGAPRVRSLTSGSSGMPRLIEWQGEQQWEQWNGHWSGSRPPITTSIVTAPLYFGGQYGIFMHAWRHGAELVLLDKFDAEGFLAAVERHRANHAYMVPTMFVRLLRLPRRVRERYDLRSLDYVIHTGGFCPLEIKRQMLDWWGPIIWESYGTTETATVSACSSEEWLAHPGTVGRPVRRVLVLDDADREAPVGKAGRLFVDVANMPPVIADGRATQAFRQGGREFLPTGDVGFIDEDGYLYVSGRADDLINTGRVKVYPLEIENAILQHPAALDCIVFPIPDPEFGQIIGAVVQVPAAEPGLATEIREFLLPRLSEHKLPARLWLQDGPLRGETGKFNRDAVARRWIAAVTEAPPAPQGCWNEFPDHPAPGSAEAAG